MNCPKCNEKACIVTQTRGVTTLLGAGAGGYVAATAGAKTGAAIGSLFCPGIGTAIGGLLGILTGAAPVRLQEIRLANSSMRMFSVSGNAPLAVMNGGLHNGQMSGM